VTGSVGGILYPAALPTFSRLAPPAAIEHLVEWFWIPEWNIAHGRISRQEVIAYPASNFVVEPELVSFTGPTTRRTHRDLMGRGWAVGALLRPAAVPAFTDDPESLRDDVLSLGERELRTEVTRAMRTPDPQKRLRAAVDVAASWLSERVTPPTEEALLANRMVSVIGNDSAVLRIEDAAAALDVSPRTLQRLAKRYVGLPPSALIRRRRLQEATVRLRTEPEADLAGIAAELGYADQSHLTKDFQRVLGFTPNGYRRSQP
jgi:AraC-like DNA-binding protein